MIPLNLPSFLRLLLVLTLFSAAALIPFAGLFFLLFLPLLLYVLCFRSNPGTTLIAFLSSLCILLIALSLLQTYLPVLALAAMGGAGILMARLAARDYAVEYVIGLPALVVVGAIVFYFFYGGMQLSIGPWDLVKKHITEAIDVNIQLYGRLPLNPEEIQGLQNSKPAIISLFTGIFPALCVVSVLFTLWVNLLLAGKILRRWGIVLPRLSVLAEWKAPSLLVWIFIAGGGLALIPHQQIGFAGVNVFLTAAFVYFLQGLSIVSFFFQNKDISLFFRWLFYFLIAIQQMLMIAIAAVGFLDLWIDFRKFFRKTQTTE